MTAPQVVRFSDLCHPLPRQREAWDAAEDHKYVLYGGARGPGKSYWLRWSLIRLLLRWARQGHTGVRVGLFSVDYPTLKDRQLSKAKIEFPDYLGHWHDQDHEFRLYPQYGAGVICFRNLDEPSKYKSAEFAAIAVEELTESPRTVFDTLRGSLRWPGIEDTKFLAASNPGGIGHAWVRAYWIDRDFPPELRAQADRFAFVRALATDNPHLPASYLEELRALPDKMRRAWLEGDWSVFEGQVFEEWRDELHVLPRDFEVPPGWRWSAGLDWGYHAPGCLLLFAQGPDGQAVAWLEWYFQNTLAQDAGKRVAELCLPYPVEAITYDEQMGYQTGAGQLTIIEEFLRGLGKGYGQRPLPALIKGKHGPESRLPKLTLAHEWLRPVPDGLPRLRFHPRCQNAIRTIPSLPYSDRRPEDVDTDGEDHSYDAMCLWLSSRPQPSAQVQPSQEWDNTHPGWDYKGSERKKRRYEVEREDEEASPGHRWRIGSRPGSIPQRPDRPTQDLD